jgi:hypothetical protein
MGVGGGSSSRGRCRIVFSYSHIPRFLYVWLHIVMRQVRKQEGVNTKYKGEKGKKGKKGQGAPWESTR